MSGQSLDDATSREVESRNVEKTLAETQTTEPVTPDGEEPTEAEAETLRRVSDRIPPGAWLVAFLAFADNFIYYGISTPFQNYIQNPPDDPSTPGALGLGEADATNIGNSFQLFTALASTPAAIVADSVLGRYWSLVVSTGIYLVGGVLLLFTSLPVSIRHGAGLPGLIVSTIVLGIASGGYKACTAAFIGDQYMETKSRVKTTKNGERVVVHRDVTIETIYTIYYWAQQIGAVAGILACTLLEKDVAFWAAYLLPVCCIVCAALSLVLGRKLLVARPVEGSALSKAFAAMWYGIRGGWNMEKSRPEYVQEHHGKTVSWNDRFVDELKRCLVACRVFLPWPLYLLCQAQVTRNLITLSADMETHGVPNDLILIVNPIAIVVMLPFVQSYLYPFLRRLNIQFLPISRITFGYLLEASAMAYASILQHLVYTKGPCYDSPRNCPASPNGSEPNRISAFLLIPIFILEAIGEVFSCPTIFEYAYTKAPASLKSMPQAIFILMQVASSILGYCFTPMYKDPLLVIFYAILSGATFAAMIAGWFAFRKYNSLEEDMNKLDADDETFKATAVVKATDIET